MSFAIVRVGDRVSARDAITSTEGVRHGGALEDLTREYLGRALDLVSADDVVVEASGHADDKHLNVTINVRTVYQNPA